MTTQFKSRINECMESWQKDHDVVMRNYEESDNLSALIVRVVECYDEFGQSTAKAPITARESLSTCEFLQLWYECAVRLATVANRFEEHGYPVPGSSSLHSRLKDVSVYINHVPDQISALNQFLAGEGVAFDPST